MPVRKQRGTINTHHIFQSYQVMCNYFYMRLYLVSLGSQCLPKCGPEWIRIPTLNAGDHLLSPHAQIFTQRDKTAAFSQDRRVRPQFHCLIQQWREREGGWEEHKQQGGRWTSRTSWDGSQVGPIKAKTVIMSDFMMRDSSANMEKGKVTEKVTFSNLPTQDVC